MAETTFKAIPFDQLPADDKGTITYNAQQMGITPEEYYKSRGGVNAAGYFGDSYVEGLTLTDEEYAQAKAAGTAGKTGLSINTASDAKARAYYKSKGYTPQQIDALVGGTARMGAGGAFISTGMGGTGGTGGFNGPGSEGYDARKSAYDLLFEQFNQYGLGALVEPLKGLVTEGISPSEFTIRLRDTDAYKKRFAANAQRIARGLTALSEAEYIGLEDQYQGIMRNYGLPESYYKRGDMGRQEGFEKFIAGDVSATELEDRIQTAQNRVINANPEVGRALREFYPDITNGDILAYALDPDKALTNIKRKVTAAEIGGAAMGQGLATGLSRAEELARFGVTGAQAREGFQAVAGVLPRASTLGNIYAKQGLGEYTQTTAEQEVFGLTGSAEAERKRRKLTELEQAQFAGSSGAAQGALARERAGQF